MFDHCRVSADNVADFLERYYLRDRYHGRGADNAAAVLASHERRFEAHGYTIISRHESITGQVVAFFSEPSQLAMRME